MSKKEKFIRIISGLNNDERKILTLFFSNAESLNNLFCPSLSNIDFIKKGNQVSVILKNNSFLKFFNSWIKDFEQRIPDDILERELVNQFNLEIRSIVLIGQKEKEISDSVAKGLFGELLYIKEQILNNCNQSDLINAWQRPAPSNHDFDFENHTLEVKTISRESNRVTISSAFQLESFEMKKHFLKIYRIETIVKSNVDSLGILYNEIISMLQPELINLFQMKCAQDQFSEYLGPIDTPLSYKFLLYEDNLFEVDQEYFPRIKRMELMHGLTNIKYCVDLSSIEQFKIN